MQTPSAIGCAPRRSAKCRNNAPWVGEAILKIAFGEYYISRRPELTNQDDFRNKGEGAPRISSRTSKDECSCIFDMKKSLHPVQETRVKGSPFAYKI
jgi:hypothetical protein